MVLENIISTLHKSMADTFKKVKKSILYSATVALLASNVACGTGQSYDPNSYDIYCKDKRSANKTSTVMIREVMGNKIPEIDYSNPRWEIIAEDNNITQSTILKYTLAVDPKDPIEEMLFSLYFNEKYDMGTPEIAIQLEPNGEYITLLEINNKVPLREFPNTIYEISIEENQPQLKQVEWENLTQEERNYYGENINLQLNSLISGAQGYRFMPNFENLFENAKNITFYLKDADVRKCYGFRATMQSECPRFKGGPAHHIKFKTKKTNGFDKINPAKTEKLERRLAY